MTDSSNTPDSNSTPGPGLTPTGQPLTPEIVMPVMPTAPQKKTGGFKVGFAFVLLAGFTVATVLAFNFSANSGNNMPLLPDPVVELLPSPLNDLETFVITDEVTLVTEDTVLEIEIPFDAQVGDVIDIPLPEGGIVIPPGGQVTFELQNTEGTLQGDREIVIEITDDGATVTDAEGNVTHQNKDGNVVTPAVAPASK